jgi:hypothetical protein
VSEIFKPGPEQTHQEVDINQRKIEDKGQFYQCTKGKKDKA